MSCLLLLLPSYDDRQIHRCLSRAVQLTSHALQQGLGQEDCEEIRRQAIAVMECLDKISNNTTPLSPPSQPPSPISYTSPHSSSESLKSENMVFQERVRTLPAINPPSPLSHHSQPFLSLNNLSPSGRIEDVRTERLSSSLPNLHRYPMNESLPPLTSLTQFTSPPYYASPYTTTNIVQHTPTPRTTPRSTQSQPQSHSIQQTILPPQSNVPRRVPVSNPPSSAHIITSSSFSFPSTTRGISQSSAPAFEATPSRRRGRPPTRIDNQCVECGTHKTPEWRRGKGGVHLCNACGLQYSKRMRREKAEKKKNAISAVLNPQEY